MSDGITDWYRVQRERGLKRMTEEERREFLLPKWRLAVHNAVISEVVIGVHLTRRLVLRSFLLYFFNPRLGC